MAKRQTFWDEPKYQRMLKKLAAQELSTAEIAAKMTAFFGFTITKNSIVGRAYRTSVELSQPRKLAKMQAQRGQGLQEWIKNPENNAYRLSRLKASYLTKIG